MKLEEQVTSLELSKELKRLGVKQESLWYWQEMDESLGGGFQLQHKRPPQNNFDKYQTVVSSFTVAELGEMLPDRIESKKYTDNDKWRMFKNGGWEITYDDLARTKQVMQENEANARAGMLIYLIENKLIQR